MKVLFAQFNGVEMFFLICAIIGGMFVLFRLIMQFAGLDHDTHDIDAHHSDSDVGFKLLSLHGLTSFLMMFGLVGLALYRQSKIGISISIIGGILAGLFSVWIIRKLFSMTEKLQSSGTISIDSTVGAQGKVYMRIPENGTGRVLINVKNSLREYDASANDGTKIDTGDPVRVIWVDGNVLVVEKI
jgi:membrane protein implicated in regulation of membrane protease activity